MKHLDRLAEDSVREAIESVVKSGKRAHSGSVPPEAERLLRGKMRGRLSEAEAALQVKRAVERLGSRKTIKAPQAKYTDWAILDKPTPANDGGATST